MSHLRVSPRHLGQMLVDTFCERCFYYQLLMRFRLPFDRPMPGIMFHLDLLEKQLVDHNYAASRKLPIWLKDLECKKPVEFPRKMTMEFPKYEITMVGMPDAVFRKWNDKLLVADYKTALHKGDADPFLPVYETQLLGYTALLEENNVGKVESAALIYFENKLKDEDVHPLDLKTNEGFNVPFRATIHEVEINRPALEPLLERIRNYADLRFPPEGREKCKDCALLQFLLDLEVSRRGAEDFAKQRDRYSRLVVSRDQEARRQRARDAWLEDDDVEFAPDSSDETQDSRPASWDV